MTDLRGSFRQLADAEPESTRIDPYAAITASRARSRSTRHRWLAAGTTVGTLALVGALVVNTIGLRPYGSAPAGSPNSAPTASVPTALAPVTKLLEQWGFEPEAWEGVTDGGPNGRVALAASGTYAFVATGSTRVTDGTEPGCADECLVTKDTAGTLDDQWYYETVWMSEADKTAVILRSYGNGTWAWVSLPGLAVGSLDAHPDRPFVSLGRLELLANAVGVPPGLYPEPQLREIARATLQDPQSREFSVPTGTSYMMNVACVAQRPSLSVTYEVVDAGTGKVVLSGSDNCDGYVRQEGGSSWRYSGDDGATRHFVLRIEGPTGTKAYVILKAAPK